MPKCSLCSLFVNVRDGNRNPLKCIGNKTAVRASSDTMYVLSYYNKEAELWRFMMIEVRTVSSRLACGSRVYGPLYYHAVKYFECI